MTIEEASYFLDSIRYVGRLRLLYLIASRPGITVQSLVAETGMPQSLVSSHLAICRAANLVIGRRQGRTVPYYIVPDRFIALRDFLGSAFCAREEG